MFRETRTMARRCRQTRMAGRPRRGLSEAWAIAGTSNFAATKRRASAISAGVGFSLLAAESGIAPKDIIRTMACADAIAGRRHAMIGFQKGWRWRTSIAMIIPVSAGSRSSYHGHRITANDRPTNMSSVAASRSKPGPHRKVSLTALLRVSAWRPREVKPMGSVKNPCGGGVTDAGKSGRARLSES